MSKHIVIDARQYSTSSGRYVRELISGLESLDKQNRYSILLLPKDQDQYQPSNPNFVKVTANYPQFSLSEQFSFIWFIKQLKPDLVHFAFAQQPMFYLDNKLTTIHDLTPLRFVSGGMLKPVYLYMRFFYRLLLRSVVASSKAIIAPSTYTKEDIVNLTSSKRAKKISVIYEAATPDKTKPTKPKFLRDTNPEFIMYTGRPAPHKNLDKLVEAFEIISQSNPDLKLILVGKLDSNYRKLQQKVSRNQIPNVVFSDFIPDSELNWLYKHCQAYVFPSLSEGFGLPTLEAMAQGAPVVSSNATCLPEISGEAALYFNPEDVEDMALKIERVLSDKNFRNQLIARGYKQVKKYSWSKTAEQTLDIYRSLLK